LSAPGRPVGQRHARGLHRHLSVARLAIRRAQRQAPAKQHAHPAAVRDQGGEWPGVGGFGGIAGSGQQAEGGKMRCPLFLRDAWERNGLDSLRGETRLAPISGATTSSVACGVFPRRAWKRRIPLPAACCLPPPPFRLIRFPILCYGRLGQFP
jgi:hypothetical protein